MASRERTSERPAGSTASHVHSGQVGADLGADPPSRIRPGGTVPLPVATRWRHGRSVPVVRVQQLATASVPADQGQK